MSYIGDVVDMLVEFLNEEVSVENVMIVDPNEDIGRFNFIATNYVKNRCNDNKVNKTFNFETARVGLRTDFSSTEPIFDPPNSYSELYFIGHGAASKHCTIKGSRMILVDF